MKPKIPTKFKYFNFLVFLKTNKNFSYFQMLTHVGHQKFVWKWLLVGESMWSQEKNTVINIEGKQQTANEMKTNVCFEAYIMPFVPTVHIIIVHLNFFGTDSNRKWHVSRRNTVRLARCVRLLSTKAIDWLAEIKIDLHTLHVVWLCQFNLVGSYLQSSLVSRMFDTQWWKTESVPRRVCYTFTVKLGFRLKLKDY